MTFFMKAVACAVAGTVAGLGLAHWSCSEMEKQQELRRRQFAADMRKHADMIAAIQATYRYAQAQDDATHAALRQLGF